MSTFLTNISSATFGRVVAIASTMLSLLDPKLKFREHIIELVLVVLVIILTGVYLSMDGVYPSRAITMAIPFVRPLPKTRHLVRDPTGEKEKITLNRASKRSSSSPIRC